MFFYVNLFVDHLKYKGTTLQPTSEYEGCEYDSSCSTDILSSYYIICLVVVFNNIKNYS